MHYTVTADVDATEMFADESANWHYCLAFATFTRSEACEFLLHCDDYEYAESKANQMRAAGCSAPFIDAYLTAAKSGAVRVIFYA